jgi:hypothetical protein
LVTEADELNSLEVLRILVEAHEKRDPRMGRVPIMYARHMGGASLHHHGFDAIHLR